MGATSLSVDPLPFRAEVTFYSVEDYATFPQCSSTFRKCRIFVPNVPLSTFRARCCVVPYPIVFRYVSLIFPFLKRKKSGKRANNERINDDAWVIAWRRKSENWKLKIEKWLAHHLSKYFNFQFSPFNFRQSSNQRLIILVKLHLTFSELLSPNRSLGLRTDWGWTQKPAPSHLTLRKNEHYFLLCRKIIVTLFA